jgi:hypothetical protein
MEELVTFFAHDAKGGVLYTALGVRPRAIECGGTLVIRCGGRGPFVVMRRGIERRAIHPVQQGSLARYIGALLKCCSHLRAYDAKAQVQGSAYIGAFNSATRTAFS